MTDHTDTDAAGTEALRQRLSTAPPREVRAAIRSNAWTGTTHGLARGHVHANIAIVPEAYALDFMRFCQRNPKPCPILDVTDTGDPEFARIAPGSDIRTDLSGYSIYRDGVFTGTAHDITDLWRGDLVAFAMGCSLSFDEVLMRNGLDVAHMKKKGGRIAVYKSGIDCVPAGPFAGPMVVSMRPIPRDQVARVVEVTSRYPATHGGPVHIGDPALIGIHDLDAVDWGEANAVPDDHEMVYWGCGVTPQAVAMAAKLPFMIAHTTGHMLMTDLTLEDIATC